MIPYCNRDNELHNRWLMVDELYLDLKSYPISVDVNINIVNQIAITN
ncbi:hypothetical protein GCM10009347_22530 [Shewanella algicola]|nr:hypothetical protein GCM10009347_22530 [Shewanella algicola]